MTYWDSFGNDGTNALGPFLGERWYPSCGVYEVRVVVSTFNLQTINNT